MQDDFSLQSYDYSLPEEQIAQHPAVSRDCSRLLVLHRSSGNVEHRQFHEITEYIDEGDVLVVNDTRVFPARLLGWKETGGKAEVFLLEYPRLQGKRPGNEEAATATALIKSSRRPAKGSVISFTDAFFCTVGERLDNTKVIVTLHFSSKADLADLLLQHGTVPLPPYIERTAAVTDEDRKRYQTIYARSTGAVAAPTAGLHFTDTIFDALRNKGVHVATLTLHVGYGTFAPVRVSSIQEHRIHGEYISVPEKTAEQVNRVKANGGKIWAVGTTTVRALEFAAGDRGIIEEFSGWCDLYIYPGYKYKVVDNLITNFHLPKSSLLFLVSALCGREQLLDCYREAIARGYRFYSYGDAMAILS